MFSLIALSLREWMAGAPVLYLIPSYPILPLVLVRVDRVLRVAFALPIGVLTRGDSPFIGEGWTEGRKEGETFA